MDRGLYIAASGMLAELTRQDQIANDLANSSTPGYKPDRSAQRGFADLLLANRQSGQPIGPLSLGVAISTIRTDMTQGPLRQTGEPLDLALQGDGFFAVKTTAGTRYTRDGQFSLDGQGRLVTSTGLPVLDDRGQELQLGNGSPTVAPDGTISVGGRNVGRPAIVSLQNAAKQGDTLFAGTPGARPAATTVVQGSLEGSGVDPAHAMVEMMESMRAFEASQRVIHAIDETLSKGVNGGQG